MQIAAMDRHWIIVTAAVLSVVWYSPGLIAGERARGDEIQQLLSGRTVAGVKDGEAWGQTFFASGSTLYIDRGGRESRGVWEVRGDSYCSLWPPATQWACYDIKIEADGSFTFVNAFGDRWPARHQ